MKIRLVQFNPVVGDVRGNGARIAEAVREAEKAGAGVTVFPQMALSGNPTGDLVWRPAFMEAVQEELQRLREVLPQGMPVVLGTPLRGQTGVGAAAVVFEGGRMHVVGREESIVADGIRIGFADGDVWGQGWAEWDGGREGKRMEGESADVLLRLEARVYLRGHEEEGEALARKAAKNAKVPVLGVNLSGAQDGLVFDGAAVAVGADGEVKARSGLFGEGALDVEVEKGGGIAGGVAPVPEELEAVYAALVTGIRDYALKNHFPGALIALSGGIDSALVAALAVDALGPERVMGVTLPSTVTSSETLDDALDLARRLGIPCLRIPIAPAVDAVLGMLEPAFASVDWAKPLPGTLVEENLQARVRGVVAMALSNRYGHLVLSTGNKSESSTGYATLYGDMCGGFAPIKDVPKTLVFELARWRNRRGEVIPPSTIARPPSAELRPGQKDTDSLPPYDVLDPVLERFMDGRESVADLVASGVPGDVARRVARLVVRSEYKRRQAAPGVTLSAERWRMPVTDGFDAW